MAKKTGLVCLLWLLSGLNLEAEEYQELPILDEDRQHWSFMPIERSPLPEVQGAEWAQNPIDFFILKKLNDAGITPLPEAKRRILVRRAFLDLTGLPPSYDGVVADQSYVELIDQLLASPRFGERQAQHWLDLARFAETDGFEHDKVRPTAWKYRDWVISAFNANLPYDEFVIQQLAADEMSSDNDRTPTMFCLAGPDMPDINSQLERRHSLLNELTSTVGAVFMGLQVGCAQCHDHKFDPISQADFYRMRALFQPAVHVTKNKSVSALKELAEPKPAFLMTRGDFDKPDLELAPGFLRVVSTGTVPAIGKTSSGTSGRRLALAHWLVSRKHPLTARVMMNRLWQQHFGTGLVSTLSDFGIMGTSPTHPELLDWLAAEFQQHWDLKVMHKLILTSATYRQASQESEQFEENKKADPDNLLWSRFPRQRLDGEVIRDSMLMAAGLKEYQMGGPGVRPPLQKEVAQTLLKNQWDVSPKESEHYRRSVYVFARRNLRYPFFEAFDRPDANVSCPQRQKSTTAPQALILFNSKMTLDLARKMAGDILSDCQDDDTFIREALRRCWSREPEPEILQATRDFFKRSLEASANASLEELKQVAPTPLPADLEPHKAAVYTEFCIVAFNTLEFIVIQ